MKRILHIISQYPGSTGSGIYLQALIREGKKKGYIQGLVAGMPANDNTNYKYVDNFYPVNFGTDKIPFPIVGMSDIMPYVSTKYSDLTEEMLIKWRTKFQYIIEKAIDEFKPDIIVSHHLWLITSLVKKIAPDIRTIGICHGTDIRQLENCPQYRLEVLEGCGQLELILSLSKEQKDLINNVYNISKDKIKVIGGGYDGEVFFPPLNKLYKEEIKIIYAGKLSYAKGVASLIKVFDRLKHKYNVRLLIVGTGTGKEEQHIKDLGYELKSKIEFIGEVPQEKLGELFRQSDIFILPSFYEGLSLVTIEALASGLLVVSTVIPGLISYLGDDVNNSGVIEYVELPQMIELDKPLEGELHLFEDRLKIGIERQIKRLKQGVTLNQGVMQRIENMSWEKIFEIIEINFKITIDQ